MRYLLALACLHAVLALGIAERGVGHPLHKRRQLAESGPLCACAGGVKEPSCRRSVAEYCSQRQRNETVCDAANAFVMQADNKAGQLLAQHFDETCGVDFPHGSPCDCVERINSTGCIAAAFAVCLRGNTMCAAMALGFQASYPSRRRFADYIAVNCNSSVVATQKVEMNFTNMTPKEFDQKARDGTLKSLMNVTGIRSDLWIQTVVTSITEKVGSDTAGAGRKLRQVAPEESVTTQSAVYYIRSPQNRDDAIKSSLSQASENNGEQMFETMRFYGVTERPYVTINGGDRFGGPESAAETGAGAAPGDEEQGAKPAPVSDKDQKPDAVGAGKSGGAAAATVPASAPPGRSGLSDAVKAGIIVGCVLGALLILGPLLLLCCLCCLKRRKEKTVVEETTKVEHKESSGVLPTAAALATLEPIEEDDAHERRSRRSKEIEAAAAAKSYDTTAYPDTAITDDTDDNTFNDTFNDTRRTNDKSPPRGPLRQTYSQKFSSPPPPPRLVDTFGNRYTDSAAPSTASAATTGALGYGGISTSPMPRSPTHPPEAELEPYPPPRAGYGSPQAYGGGFGSRFVEPSVPKRNAGYATTSSLL